jgi:mRNA interferase MazF
VAGARDAIQRGEIWWTDLPQRQRCAVITSNAELADAPGSVLLRADLTGLSRDSVVNVSQLLTLDRGFLTEQAGALPPHLQHLVDKGLRLVLQLP